MGLAVRASSQPAEQVQLHVATEARPSPAPNSFPALGLEPNFNPNPNPKPYACTHVVRWARRGMRTGEQAKAVRALERAGARVAVSTLDVEDAGQTAQLVALAGQGAPLAGVFHLAMYLDDRLMASQVLPLTPR